MIKILLVIEIIHFKKKYIFYCYYFSDSPLYEQQY